MAKKSAKDTTLENFSFFNEMKTGNRYADATERVKTSTIDTGCYVLNALYSGDMNVGFPSDKVLMLAGEEAVGKTYFAIRGHVVPLSRLENRFIFYFDTENAVTEDLLIDFGLQPGSFKIIRESTVEKCRTTMVTILDRIEEKVKNSINSKFRCAFILDSLGQLATEKIMENSSEGKFVRDMTKQQQLKQLFAVVTNRMGLLDIPFIMTNHVYKMIGSMVPMNEISGGSGALYASSTIIELKKRQMVDEKRNRKGSIIIAKARKSRKVREGSTVSMYLDFETGLNKWFGLHLLAQDAGFLEEWKPKHEKLGVISPILPEVDDSDDSDESDTKKKKTKVWVIKHPDKPANEWIACLEKDIHKPSTIGTIFDPLNEWIKKNFSLSKMKDELSDSDLDSDKVAEQEAEIDIV